MNMTSLSRIAILLSISGGLVAAARPAEACSLALPSIKAWHPAAEEAGVHVSSRLWIKGNLSEVTLAGGGRTITTTLTRMGEQVAIYEARPSEALAPSTRYTVTAKGPDVAEPTVFAFTTGAGTQPTAPLPPPSIGISATTVWQAWDRHCNSFSDAYRLEIDAEPVGNAVFYQLLERRDGQLVVIAADDAPRFVEYSVSLPSATYAIRPVGQGGESPAEAALPTDSAIDDDEPGDEGGCSAASSTSGSSSGSSVLWLGAILAGLTLGARRRRGRGLAAPL